MIAAKKNDASDADINPFIYLVVAYLIGTPETTTPEHDTTFHEPCSISLNKPSIPMINPSQLMNCKAAGTHVEYFI